MHTNVKPSVEAADRERARERRPDDEEDGAAAAAAAGAGEGDDIEGEREWASRFEARLEGRESRERINNVKHESEQKENACRNTDLCCTAGQSGLGREKRA